MAGGRGGSGGRDLLLPGQAQPPADPADLHVELARCPRPEYARDARRLRVVVPADVHAHVVAPRAEGETLLHQAPAQLEGEELARDAAVEVLVHDSRVIHPDLQVAMTEVVL